MYYEPTQDDLRRGLLELERRSEEMKQRFAAEYSRMYAQDAINDHLQPDD